jgi:alkylation response protein AidB-like acyl-CoA dehydrogenase
VATTPVSQSVNRGGAFLVAAGSPAEIFTPADVTDDQRLIGQTAAEFVAKEIVPLIPDLEKHAEGLMAKALKKAGAIGLLGAGIPEAYGGSELDKISATVLTEKISVYASFAVAFGGTSGIGTIPIASFGTEEQKRKYLPKIASGELLAAYCLSEPQAGSDSLAARTRAVLSPDGKNWILNGQKMWITNGGFADVYIVFAKVDGTQFSAFIVERGTPGFTVGAAAARLCRYSLRMRRCPRKIFSMKSAAVISWPSTRSTPGGTRLGYLAWAVRKERFRTPRNIPGSGRPSGNRSVSSA